MPAKTKLRNTRTLLFFFASTIPFQTPKIFSPRKKFGNFLENFEIFCAKFFEILRNLPHRRFHDRRSIAGFLHQNVVDLRHQFQRTRSPNEKIFWTKNRIRRKKNRLKNIRISFRFVDLFWLAGDRLFPFAFRIRRPFFFFYVAPAPLCGAPSFGGFRRRRIFFDFAFERRTRNDCRKKFSIFFNRLPKNFF